MNYKDILWRFYARHNKPSPATKRYIYSGAFRDRLNRPIAALQHRRDGTARRNNTRRYRSNVTLAAVLDRHNSPFSCSDSMLDPLHAHTIQSPSTPIQGITSYKPM